MTFTIILSLVVLPVEPHPPPLYGKGSERQKSECRKYKSCQKLKRIRTSKVFFLIYQNIKIEVVDQNVKNQKVEKNIKRKR